MLHGEITRFPGKVTEAGPVEGMRVSRPISSPEPATLLISEIRDRYGNVLYRAEVETEEFASEHVGIQVRDILENVVRWGTGRRANGVAEHARMLPPVSCVLLCGAVGVRGAE